MKYENAYMTVEASLIIPFMLLIFINFFYLLVYSYDRALLFGDSVHILTLAVRSYDNDEETLKEILNEKYENIKNTHPYLAGEGPEIDFEVKNNEIKVRAGFDFFNPLSGMMGIFFFEGENKIEVEISEKLLRPEEMMYITRDFQE